MDPNPSPASAETGAAAAGDQPQAAAETQEQKPPTAAEVLGGDNLEDIRALMRENAHALVPKVSDDGWSGLNDEDTTGAETPPAEEPDSTDAAPAGESGGAEGEAAGGEPTPEETAAAAAAAEAAAAEAAAAEAEGKKPANRVRIKLFAEADQPVIQLMAANKGMTFEEARAQLQAEGKLPKTDATAAAAVVVKPPPEPVAAATAEITAQQATIADLETQIATAATAFDSPAVAKLTIAHNRALQALAKLEQKAEGAQAAQQQQAQQTFVGQKTASETQAIALFPDAAKKGTPLYEMIEDLMDVAPATAFQDPDYPLTFAAKAAAKIGYKAPAVAAEKPPVVPKKPARPVPPQLASGSAAAAGARKTATLEQRMDAAEKSGDIQGLKDLLREAGTKTLD